MFVTPSSPGDGAATPGGTAGQGAAPPGDQVILADARGWPLPPPCPGYRTVYIMGVGNCWTRIILSYANQPRRKGEGEGNHHDRFPLLPRIR